MSITLTDFKNRVLRRLNVPEDSDVGALDAGGGGGAPLTTLAYIVDLINTCGAEIAESCWPLPGTATVTVTTALPILDLRSGSPAVALDDTAVHDSLWIVRGMQYTTPGDDPVTTTLEQVSRPVVQIRAGGPPERVPATSGAPAAWYRPAQNVVGLYPPPNAGSLTLAGLCRPKAISRSADADTTPVFPYLPDAYIEPVAAYVAARIAVKQAQDQTLADRVGVWTNEYDAWRAKMWQGVDEATKRVCYPNAPGAPISAGAASLSRGL